MDKNSSNYSLVDFLAENVSLPLSEIHRQIDLGLCSVNGETTTNPHYGIIPGLIVTMGKITTIKA